MTNARPIRPRPPEAPEAPALQARAIDNLRFIRETMERAGAFTAVSGVATAGIGLTALAAAAVAGPRPAAGRWLAVWLAEAVLALAISAIATLRKSRAAEVPLFSGAGRKFLLSFSPPMLAGALLTLVLVQAGLPRLLPGSWLLLYGTAVVCAGAFSVRIVPVMGFGFMLAGTAAFFLPTTWSTPVMALAFGGLHILFGILIARSYGG
jgi:hypothetical protein